jgi:RNA polymerase sigma-B factor
MIARWQEHRDQKALDVVVRQYMPLVRSLARRYAHSSMPLEDLEQVGALGLVKAIGRFDPSWGTKLETFAVPTILGELRRYFRDSGWGVHVRRKAQEQALLVRDAQQQLTNETGRVPSSQQVAEFLEIDVEDVLEGLQVLQAYEPGSLDAPLTAEDNHDTTLGETIGHEDPNYELVERVNVTRIAVKDLDERQRELLCLRFGDELSQAQIAAKIGVSQMQVSRLLRATIECLRATIETPPGGMSAASH